MTERKGGIWAGTMGCPCMYWRERRQSRWLQCFQQGILTISSIAAHTGEWQGHTSKISGRISRPFNYKLHSIWKTVEGSPSSCLCVTHKLLHLLLSLMCSAAKCGSLQQSHTLWVIKSPLDKVYLVITHHVERGLKVPVADTGVFEVW